MALRAALRRWRGETGNEERRGFLSAVGRRSSVVRHPPAWWPRLTAPQAQALLSAAVTLALLLWDHVRQRLGK